MADAGKAGARACGLERHRPLLDAGHHEVVAALASYLEHAGNARAAAAALHLHRATLYHRLRRVERLCGVDLTLGEDRLRIHIALRMLRLAGRLKLAAA